ncbi:unnamed protein product [Ixodes pacificus]
MPPASASRPTMKPARTLVMQQVLPASYKSHRAHSPPHSFFVSSCSTDSENKTPLFPMIPTGKPVKMGFQFDSPVTSVSPYRALNSSNLLPSTTLAITYNKIKGMV